METHKQAGKAKKIHRRSVLPIAASLLACFQSAQAEVKTQQPASKLFDMDIKELMTVEIDSVYGASKFKQKITEAPASISIITSEEIQKYGYRTLADVLRNVRGFYVTNDRNYSYLGFRGYGRPGDYNSRVQLLVDGHLLNDSVYGQALLGTEFPIDIDLIDRVEVIRGPNSSLYLASAFFGVINIITKRGEELKGTNVSAQFASHGTGQGRISYGNKFANSLEMALSASYHDSNGPSDLYFEEFDDPSTNNGIAKNADDDRFQQLWASFSYGRFTLHGVYGSREKGIPTASFGTVFNDARTRTIDARSFVDLKYDRVFDSGMLLSSRIFFDSYDYDGTYIYDFSSSGGPSSVPEKDTAVGSWWGIETNLSRKLLERHQLTVGFEYRDNFRQDQAVYDIEPFFQYLNDRRRSSSWGLYAQDEIKLGSKLALNLGLRYDRYSTFGATANPRAAIIYNVRANAIIKLLHAQTFRAPNFYELYYNASGSDPNPSLKPETVKSTELIWEQYFAHQFRLTMTGFHYPIRRLISAQTNPGTGNIQYDNLEEIDIRGVDFSIRKKTSWGLEGQLSYSFQNAENERLDTPLANSPKHLGNTKFSMPLIKQKLFASISLDYVGKRRTFSGNYTKAFAVPNVTFLSRNMPKGWEFSASIYNLFDRRYGDPGGEEHLQDIIFQDGMKFRLKAEHRF